MACLCLLGCLGIAAPARGQEPAPPAPPQDALSPPAPAEVEAPAPQPDPEPVERQPPAELDIHAPAKTDVTLDRRTVVRAGVGLAGPIGVAASVQLLHGLGADVKDDGTRVNAVCALPIAQCAKGFLLRADAGTGGGKLSLGLGAWARVREDDFKGTAGAALRLTLARTWGDPVGQPTGNTYLGPELDLSVIRINLTLGVLFKLAGATGSSTAFSWGLGFGL
ncbi:MAG TPA: hypothetical protein VFQ51_01635 [Vicinamibacteria bacterium]|nr:hypothetical protein [Vicinamibacteria bacterium]